MQPSWHSLHCTALVVRVSSTGNSKGRQAFAVSANKSENRRVFGVFDMDRLFNVEIPVTLMQRDITDNLATLPKGLG